MYPLQHGILKFHLWNIGKTLHIFLEINQTVYGNNFLSAWMKFMAKGEKWPLLPFYYYWPDKYGPLATAESSRRYKSWFQFSQTLLGTPNVLSPAILQPDFRFFNPLNTLLRYDNSPMTEIIIRHWKNKEGKVEPIKTTDGQPRLLIVAVDVQDATTVTFDSYPKEEGRMMSVYGDEDKVKHEIYYDKGIEITHLLTTMSSHVSTSFLN